MLWQSGTSTSLLNLRLGSEACAFFHIAKTIRAALHPKKGRRSYAHFDAVMVTSTTELDIAAPEMYTSRDE